ncbi:MAG: glycosyltransferase [Vicinamibacterales bacterium]
MPERPVAYILGTFPQASQTFIAREVRGLKLAGVPMLVFALGRREPDVLEDADRVWYPDVRFAPLFLAPAVLAANVRMALHSPGRYARTFCELLALPHRPRILVLRAVALFMTAAWIAHTLERAGGCRQVHAHFALAQTEVAMAVSGLLDVPFSFTAHARDIYATPSALEEKIRAARVVVTCTDYNVTHLRRLCPELPAAHVQLVHHGVDVDEASRIAEGRRVHTDARPVILAAGRLIDKKGFDTLIEACARLHERGRLFECRIFGTGPLMAALRRRADAAGLASIVELPGWAPAGRLLDAMGTAAVFAMPSRVATGGDRDGIPNVVLEAMATGLPVVATNVSGIPEAVSDGRTGLLVEPDDVTALADALERVLTDAALSSRFGAAARARIAEEFTLQVASSRLQSLFGLPDPLT